MEHDQNRTPLKGPSDEGVPLMSLDDAPVKLKVPYLDLQIIQKQLEDFKSMPYFKLFKYATFPELILLSIGILLTVIQAAFDVASILIYAEYFTYLFDNSDRGVMLLSNFGPKIMVNESDPVEYKEVTMHNARAFIYGYLMIIVVEFILQTLAINILNSVALRQISRIRYSFLKAILRQEMTWYDTHSDLNFVNYINEDLDKIRDGIAERVVLFVFVVVMYVFGIGICFNLGWKLALITLIPTPFLVFSTFMSVKATATLSAKESQAYSQAAAHVVEVLSSIRTVVAFNGENKELKTFSDKLAQASNAITKKGKLVGLWSGLLHLTNTIGFCLTFWVGAKFVLDGIAHGTYDYAPGTVAMISFQMVYGAQCLGFALPYLDTFAKAKGAAGVVYRIIDRVPLIDSLSTIGRKPSHIDGEISLKNVFFSYPTRADVQVLKNFSLTIKQGENVTLVGPSGCGKSTVLQLIQRMYDPQSGWVSVDGADIRSLNVNWYRSQIAVVGQEPVLFANTIANNILFGNPSATRKDIEDAAKIANCYDFIMQLPNGFDTEIGEKGTQLSGGQKQRIAIARAIIRRPKILLLDEATSALDRYNEKMVQDALNRISENITTISITHRLTSISQYDKIVLMDNGEIKEIGTHAKLFSARGDYYKLVTCAKEKENNNQEIESKTEPEKFPTTKTNDLNGKTYSNNDHEEIKYTFEKQEHLETKNTNVLWRVIKLNKPEWCHIITVCFFSITLGALIPIFAGLCGYIAAEFGNDDMTNITLLIGASFAIGVVLFVSTFLRSILITKSGTVLTKRLRQTIFASILKQEMSWFDDDKNNSATLATVLSTDAAVVQNVTSVMTNTILEHLSVIVIGFIITAFYSVILSMIAIPIVLMVLFLVWLENLLNKKSAIKEKEAQEKCSRIANEAIANIKTVQSLCLESDILRRFRTELDNVTKVFQWKNTYRGFMYSMNKFSPCFAFCGCMYYAAYLVSIRQFAKEELIVTCRVLVYGVWMVGITYSFMPDFNVAKLSTKRIFKLIDKQPQITTNCTVSTPENWKSDGSVRFDNISFNYPSRPDVKVLDHFTLNIDAKKTVALIGQSGCGKSTCIQLLQRLYEPRTGTICVDDKDIAKNLTLTTLRNQFGLVSQEPVLFNRTIQENIAYGDNSRVVPVEEIIQAAKKSNIHDFITSLPQGYATILGAKGGNVSGGQKQRIAIARALVRNPKILLLDEATSALDNESETIVQAALDEACKNRTSIIIAHRLRTVKNADMICVLENGCIKETGTHEELINCDSIYKKLYMINQ